MFLGKLFLCGLMLSAVFLSISGRVFNEKISFRIFSSLVCAWVLLLYIYWMFWVEEKVRIQDSKEENIKDIVSATNNDVVNLLRRDSNELNEDKSKDNRLAITIVTGFLGSGKS